MLQHLVRYFIHRRLKGRIIPALISNTTLWKPSVKVEGSGIEQYTACPTIPEFEPGHVPQFRILAVYRLARAWEKSVERKVHYWRKTIGAGCIDATGSDLILRRGLRRLLLVFGVFLCCLFCLLAVFEQVGTELGESQLHCAHTALIAKGLRNRFFGGLVLLA